MDSNFRLCVIVRDVHRLDAKRWFFVILAKAIHQVIRGGSALRKWHLAKTIQRIGKEFGGGLRKFCERLHQGALRFVELVEHGVSLLDSEMLHCNILGLKRVKNWVRRSNLA